MTEYHVCAACPTHIPVKFTVTKVRPIYFGQVYTRVCPEGHIVTEHRR